MSSNIFNQVAFLRTSREFPEDLHQLTVEINKSYLDIANTVNNRIISIFPTNRPVVNGENWFLNSSIRQQGLRQVYTFTTTADIPIGFKISSISEFTRCWGEYTDGTNWFGIIHATTNAIAGQLTFYITPDLTPGSRSDLIRFVNGGAPAMASGKIILEWISKV